jgi:hypothetical protein
MLIPVDGPPAPHAQEVNLPNGCTRFMRLGKPGWTRTSWSGKPTNQAATFLSRSFGRQFSLRGTVVITGLDKYAVPVALSPDQAGVVLMKVKAQVVQPSG